MSRVRKHKPVVNQLLWKVSMENLEDENCGEMLKISFFRE